MARSAPVPPPLLLIHGIGDSHRTWRDVLPRLDGHFECLAIDLPGFGDAPPLPGTPTMAALGAHCRAWMAARGFERFHVAGNSLGGGVALWLALSGAVDSACGLSPIGFIADWDRAYLHVSLAALRHGASALAAVAPRLPAPGRRLAFAQYFAHADRFAPERLAETLRGVAAATAFEATQRHAVNWQCPARTGLPCPVTVAWGQKDLLLLRGPQSARARRRLPSARHVVLYDCGHVPSWDDPAQTAAIIRTSTA